MSAPAPRSLLQIRNNTAAILAPRSLPQIKNNLPLSLAPHRPPQMKNNTAAIRMSAIMDVKSFNITVNSQKQY